MNEAPSNNRDEFAQALGGEYGGKVSDDGTWECSCSARGTGGAVALYEHRQGPTCSDSTSEGDAS